MVKIMILLYLMIKDVVPSMTPLLIRSTTF
jgi:hypothetical protein